MQAELGIRLEFINMGGGLGIPYRPEEEAFDVEALGQQAHCRCWKISAPATATRPRCTWKAGATSPPARRAGTRAINRKESYRTYIGVDACMSALMRPGMYGAYHHTDVGKPPARPTRMTRWWMSLFAVRKQRQLPCSAPCCPWPMAICS